MNIRFHRHLQPDFFHQPSAVQAYRIRPYAYVQADLYLRRFQIAEIQLLSFSCNHIHRFVTDGIYILHICRRFFYGCAPVRQIGRSGIFSVRNGRRCRRNHFLHCIGNFHISNIIQGIQPFFRQRHTLFQQPFRIGQRFLRNLQSRIFNYLFHLGSELLPVIFFRLFCIIAGIILIISPALFAGIRCRAVLRLIDIIHRRLHMVLHHIFYRAFSGL